MDLSVERTFPFSPAATFAALTEPTIMNRWSTARVVGDAEGDGGHPAGVGALRRIVLPHGPTLREVVVCADAPDRFVYAVVDTPGVRRHRGTITIDADPVGSRVQWHVAATLAVPPPLDGLVARRLERELGHSLDALARLELHGLALPAPPPRRSLDAVLDESYAAAMACSETQRILADRLEAKNDPRHWFTRVYQYVTEAQLEACRRGRYQHPHWVLGLIERFHALYVQSLEPAEGPEPHWKSAFDRMARVHARGASSYVVGGACIFYGMRAHIEFDLPRAIAKVYVDDYRDRCDFVRFRADYRAMADIFREASERMIDHFDVREMPWIDRVARHAPRELRDAALARRMYDIPRARRRAFAQAESLVPLLRAAAP